ncbi:MAG TPA: DUF362 domain-containing protein [Gemmataceae bacterium]|nr:DUF362 domain-containing protein [Gemmataceae bacterium]
MNEITAYLESLASLAHPEGGWGYAPGQQPHLEPTCLALLALSLEGERYAEPMGKGKAWLKQCAMPDGTYRIARGRDEAVWPTALVLFVQSALKFSQEEIDQTASALLALQGRNLGESANNNDIHDIDLKLIGWPWANGNSSWAEPTAWACFALKHAGHGDHPRVQEGLRLLLDRTCDGGGLNYGNRRILGRTTEPIPGPTALALLALQGQDPDPRVQASINYLINQAPLGDDLEHLCWAKLALATHADQPGVPETLVSLDARIKTAHEARLSTSYVQANPLREALAALALSTSSHNLFNTKLSAISSQHSAIKVNKHVNGMSKSFGERLKFRFNGLVLNALDRLKPPPPRVGVHIGTASDYNANLVDVLQRQYESFRARVPLAGKRVVLKPNLVEYHRDKVINTHPNVVAAVIELCKKEGAKEIIVAEGPGHCRNVEYLVGASGLGDVLRHYNVPFVDLNHDEPVKKPNMGRLTGLEHLFLSRTVDTAEVFISLPKLKTHHWAGATLAMKNLFGTLPGICYGWPKNELHWRGIDNSIVDINLTRTPDLAIVDGIIGMEGDGPLNGTAKPMGTLIMGCDMVAVDATCCRLMQLDPERIGYLIMGYRKKLGHLRESEIEQLGEVIASLAKPFETVTHFNELRMKAG